MATDAKEWMSVGFASSLIFFNVFGVIGGLVLLSQGGDLVWAQTCARIGWSLLGISIFGVVTIIGFLRRVKYARAAFMILYPMGIILVAIALYAATNRYVSYDQAAVRWMGVAFTYYVIVVLRLVIDW